MRRLVRSQTAQRLKKLDAELRRAAAEPKDADAIHDLRVSIRRLTEELRVFEDWFEPRHVKRVRGSLRKLMDRCAAVRNCDIAIEVLGAAGVERPKLFAGLDAERQRTRQDLSRKLKRWRSKDRARKWREYLQVGQSAPGDNAHKVARTLLPAMIDHLFRAGRAAARPESSRQTMHQFRLQTKHTRYTLELFEQVYRSRTKPIMKSLKGLQEKLGLINDCATTIEMVRRDHGAAAAVRLLADQREAEFREYWKKHFGARERVRWKAVLSAADGKE